MPLERVRHPLEYRVTAGSATSDTYRVDVLYPLKIAKIESAVQPPEYTRPAKSSWPKSGNITGLVGSQVKLDDRARPCRRRRPGWSCAPMNRRAGQTLPASKLPLAIDGKQLTAAVRADGRPDATRSSPRRPTAWSCRRTSTAFASGRTSRRKSGSRARPRRWKSTRWPRSSCGFASATTSACREPASCSR